MMIQKYSVPLSKPNLDKKDFLEIKKCFNSSWISSKSPWVAKFEKSFAEKISHTKYAISANSGTSALFLSLVALGIKPGDEVIIPAFTMIATVNAITWVGARPVLVDCRSKDDWNMNITQIEGKINSKTKAIIPVHIYGYVSNMEKVMEIAKKHRLIVIEDAAEAIGSTYKGKMAGSWGDVGCYSLYTNKIITTGNGGMVSTNNKKVYDIIRKVAFFDFNTKIHFKHNLIGYNLVMSGLQAALGFSQIKKYQKLLKKRQLIYTWYKEFLGNNHNIRFLLPESYSKPNYWFPAIIFKDKKIKNKKAALLNKHAIETRNFFVPIHLQPVYRKIFASKKYPQAEYFFKHGLLLPSFHELERDKVKGICDLLNL